MATNWDPALKRLYRDENYYKATFKDRPMYATVPKFEGFTGINMPMLAVYGNPQGRSATFSEAQGNVTTTQMKQFLLDIVSDYSLATVTGEEADRSEGNAGAFLKALQSTIDFAMDSLADAIETFLPRSGTGTIGRVSTGSTVSAQTITLAEIDDVANFEVLMTRKFLLVSIALPACSLQRRQRGTPL